MSLRVRPLSREEHLAFVAGRPSASFLQCPSWGEVKSGWRPESLGWEDGSGDVVGAGLVLYRQLPRVRRYLAYLPEGPLLDWHSADLGAWLDPMLAHLRSRSAFSVKMGPPVAVRRWEADTVKQSVSDPAATRLGDVAADETDESALTVAAELRRLGWRQDASGGAGFGDYQPRFVFQVPLTGRDDDALLKGFNQLWRRNVKKAAKAGVEVAQGQESDLAAFHALYLETAARDGFTGRPLDYFTRMWRAMRAEDPDRLRLYLARYDGELLAATLWVHVGDHVWYSYGASANHRREVRPSNAVQWQMLRDARDAGARVYDLRGISDTLDPDNDLFGLIQFKLGTGGQAVEYLGEWDFALNPLLHRAFSLYMKRR